jgi:hypothetical protein
MLHLALGTHLGVRLGALPGQCQDLVLTIGERVLRGGYCEWKKEVGDVYVLSCFVLVA